MSQIINVPIFFNNVPEQRLTHPNQLTIHSWNDTINTMRTQANAIAMYLKRLDNWFLDETNPNNWRSVIEQNFISINTAIDNLDIRITQNRQAITNLVRRIEDEESETDNEIHIGTDAPETSNYRVWINTVPETVNITPSSEPVNTYTSSGNFINTYNHNT